MIMIEGMRMKNSLVRILHSENLPLGQNTARNEAGQSLKKNIDTG